MTLNAFFVSLLLILFSAPIMGAGAESAAHATPVKSSSTAQKSTAKKKVTKKPVLNKIASVKSLTKNIPAATMPAAIFSEPNKALEGMYHQTKYSNNDIKPGDAIVSPVVNVSTQIDSQHSCVSKEVGKATDDDDDDDDDDDEDEIEETAKPAPPNKKIMIRVLLKEAATTEKVTFAIQSKKGFVLESAIGSGKRASWKHEILNLLAYEHNLFLLTTDGTYKRIKSNEVAIASVAGDLKIDNFRYTGTMYLRIDPKTKKVQMINKVNLDDYIYSVLRYESLSYWPLEMQKVQALASRSYAVRTIKTARANSADMPFYDIKNNNFNQVYNGNHDSVHLREAVNETHNLILTYNNDIALTMFDICCGGIIPGHMKKRDADKPYLYRKTQCTYCHDKTNFSWDCAFDKDTLMQRMLENPKVASKAKKIGKITGISIKEKDKAGIVHRVLIHGSKNNIIFTNNEFKSALGSRAKSNAYNVKKTSNDIVVHGYGYGHNMGLCQIGARELVSRGWKYNEILNFYFPKTKLMRLKVL